MPFGREDRRSELTRNRRIAFSASTPGADIDSPKKLSNFELGSSAASFVPKIRAAFLEMNGVVSKTMKVVNIDASSRVPMLVTRKVQSDRLVCHERAVDQARGAGCQLVCLFAGDFGLEIYANSIGIQEDFLEGESDIVEKIQFGRPCGEWKYTLDNPEEAAKIELQRVKALDAQIVVEEINILRRCAVRMMSQSMVTEYALSGKNEGYRQTSSTKKGASSTSPGKLSADRICASRAICPRSPILP